MSCFKEHVNYDWLRVIILLTLQMKIKENLQNIAKSGLKILECFWDFDRFKKYLRFYLTWKKLRIMYSNMHSSRGVWSNFCMYMFRRHKHRSIILFNTKYFHLKKKYNVTFVSRLEIGPYNVCDPCLEASLRLHVAFCALLYKQET